MIAEFFTPAWGRVPAVVKGVRGGSARMRQMAAGLQPFQELQISLRGKGELKTLLSLESASPYPLHGRSLYAALYLNELTLRLLHRLDPHPGLWDIYKHSLQGLSASVALEPVLRLYELGLLDHLGYGLMFDTEIVSGEAVVADGEYLFEAERGFSRQSGLPAYAGQVRFSGRDLLNVSDRLAQGLVGGECEWSPLELRILKQVCRQALAPLLGTQPLRSRELFTGKRS